MNKLDGEPKEKKVYEKPCLIKVELISEEAVMGYCKTGSLNVCAVEPQLICNLTSVS
jgi:hypothetical protein